MAGVELRFCDGKGLVGIEYYEVSVVAGGNLAFAAFEAG